MNRTSLAAARCGHYDRTLDAQVQELLTARDRWVLSSAGKGWQARNAILNRIYHRDQERHLAFDELQSDAASLDFSEHGVVSNWDYLE